MKIKKLGIAVISIFFLNFIAIKAKDNFAQEINKSEQNKVSLDKELEGESYLLGAGDTLNIQFYFASEFNNDYIVYNDGTIHLPLVGKVSVLNLSLEQASEIIQNKVGEELLRPDLYISVVKMRPIKVTLLGEVSRPGLYEFETDLTKKVDLVKAIQESGGVNNKANLKEVNILRKLSGQNNEYKEAKLNLIDLIFEGDLSQNIPLFDGDIIKINKASELPKELIKLSNNSLSPRNINITIVGSVVKPGTYKVANNTPLAQGLMIAGGPIPLKSNTGNIKLIRLQNNGTIYTKKFKLNLNEGISISKNPVLRDGDIILVRPNLLKRFSDTLTVVTSPITKSINTYAIIKLLGGD